jgi:uncharacterized protein (UPF0248 family)
MKTVAWDYEEGPDYYHIYALDGVSKWSDTVIDVTRSPEIDVEVQKIADCLQNIQRIIEVNKSGEQP